jgi:hypothetical protein
MVDMFGKSETMSRKSGDLAKALVNGPIQYCLKGVASRNGFSARLSSRLTLPACKNRHFVRISGISENCRTLKFDTYGFGNLNIGERKNDSELISLLENIFLAPGLFFNYIVIIRWEPDSHESMFSGGIKMPGGLRSS